MKEIATKLVALRAYFVDGREGYIGRAEQYGQTFYYVSDELEGQSLWNPETRFVTALATGSLHPLARGVHATWDVSYDQTMMPAVTKVEVVQLHIFG